MIFFLKKKELYSCNIEASLKATRLFLLIPSTFSRSLNFKLDIFQKINFLSTH